MDVVLAEAVADPVDRRHPDRDLCALQLDGHLRRLARHEAVCRRVLGRLARTFLAGRYHHQLGFARLGDYTRERLSLSAREVQELARVAERLESLPAIAAAFAAGELSWTQTRLLATATTPDSEHKWLALARDRTVRALEALVAHPPADPDERHRVHFSLRCPRRVRGRWRQAVELARRMAGSELSLAQSAEVIAAEALSARPAPIDDRPPREPPPEPVDTPADTGWSGVDVPIPEDVEKLLQLEPGGDPFALDERLRTARRAMQRIDWQMGVLLRTFFDRRLHRAFGFPSASRYVAERLGLSGRKARALVALERGLRRAPALATAYRDGTVSWLRALTVLPVAAGDGAWVARAGEVTLRRLVAEVEWALDRRDAGLPAAPPPPDAALAPVQWQMRARSDELLEADITFAAPASVVALFRGALDAFRPAGAPLWKGCEKVLEHVCAEWEAQPRHRDPIFARDAWRCAVPACTSRGNFHDHHVRYRSAGGGNSRENRITVCAWHHLRGIHLGRIRAHGTAPHAIIWEIGVRRGGPPLMRTVGERYLP
jgi:hypothetical protein